MNFGVLGREWGEKCLKQMDDDDEDDDDHAWIVTCAQGHIEGGRRYFNNYGLAYCEATGQFVTVTSEKYFALWEVDPTQPPFQFRVVTKFRPKGTATLWTPDSLIAFAPGVRNLLAVCANDNSIRLIDVTHQRHCSFVQLPTKVELGLAGLATHPSGLIAASCGNGIPSVRVYRGGDASWIHVRTIAMPDVWKGPARKPCAIDPTGTKVLVCDTHWRQIVTYSLDDATGALLDVRKWEDTNCGLTFIPGAGRWAGVYVPYVLGVPYGTQTLAVSRTSCGSMAFAKGVGLLMKDPRSCGFSVVSSPSLTAMAAMSAIRVAWMHAVFRAPRVGSTFSWSRAGVCM